MKCWGLDWGVVEDLVSWPVVIRFHCQYQRQCEQTVELAGLMKSFQVLVLELVLVLEAFCLLEWKKSCNNKILTNISAPICAQIR